MRTASMHLERRRHRRAPLGVPALLELGRLWQRVLAAEISPGGVRVCGPRLPLAQGQLVELYLELPTCVALEARAEVLRSDSSGASLRFVGLGPEQRVAIRRYCDLQAQGRAGRWAPDPLYTSVA